MSSSEQNRGSEEGFSRLPDDPRAPPDDAAGSIPRPQPSSRTRVDPVARILSSIYPGLSALRAENRELRDEIERVEYLAITDPLTGLANRRGWDMQLARELSRARRTKRPLCLGMIDIDDFKTFNDTHGHLAADRLLVEIAASWRSKIRDIDLLCRWGGDEFGLLLPDCPLSNAQEILGRLQTRMPGGQSCTAAAVCWDREESSEHMLNRADRGLYLAKQYESMRRKS